ncbi:BRO1-like domain-containing protein [Phakopsora pachyrhizi]|uniref:BRO domain-containing protein 1 n=1 Tax=Phakopsora pachyrhizi TaxID=170000 RepID=A0AAV0AXL4_PHAPC|nr:BRO1-like domain-containing protein [Phakopsora pachyrhizi]CAH7674786.1 BRO1-like domain-domain-containing protein [Phakopsora pachyrhizi]
MSSTQTPLLWVPLKVTSDVSYAPSIRQTISQTYQETPDSYKDEITALDRCRQDALRGSAGSDVTGRDLLYKYFGQLELLELRFPDVKVPFPWKDAFTGKEISQLSLAYEKASVIFNIAATLSSLAAQQNRTSTAGIKRAFHNFRCAAGMFTYINDNFLHAPSTDLSREVVKVLVQLMLAQATEVFVERMAEDREKKPFGLRARVSTQAAFLYASVVEDVKDLSNKGIFERSWTWLVQCKHKHFTSLAQYQRAMSDSAASKHGEALTRLQIAESTAKEASRFATSFSASLTTLSGSGPATLPSDAALSLTELTKTHLTLCSEAKAAEQRDNDLIYHDAQPSEAALTPIDKSNVGDPIPIQEVYATPEVQKVVGQDIFIRLVPLSVHQSSSLYSEEKAKLARTEGERCDLADTELMTALEAMGLPSSLNKFSDLFTKSQGASQLDDLSKPPAQVSKWAEIVQLEAARKPIESYLEETTALRDKTRSGLDHVERNLSSDTVECEKMRVKYDHHWEQKPTSNFSKTWRFNLQAFRETLLDANKSDSQVEELWRSSRADIEILLDRSGNSISRLYSQNVISQVEKTSGPSLLDVTELDDEAEINQLKSSVIAIRENIERLQGIKKERHEVLKDLKERVQSDDISQLLILNRKAQNIEPTLFASELEKFRAHSNRISATLHLQATTIEELTEQFKALVESKSGRELQERWNNASRAREQTTARLQRAFEAHQEIRDGLSKGIQFYSGIRDAVAEMTREIDAFISSRHTERIQMATQAEAARDRETRAGSAMSGNFSDAQQLENQMSGMNLANPSAPAFNKKPPLPPPPPPPHHQPHQRNWQSPASAPAPAPPHQGPAYQSFPPYGMPNDLNQTQHANIYPINSIQAPPKSTAPYSAPPVDPYAALNNFESKISNNAHQNPPTSSQHYATQNYSQYGVAQLYPQPDSSTPTNLPGPPPPVNYQSSIPTSYSLNHVQKHPVLPPPPPSLPHSHFQNPIQSTNVPSPQQYPMQAPLPPPPLNHSQYSNHSQIVPQQNHSYYGQPTHQPFSNQYHQQQAPHPQAVQSTQAHPYYHPNQNPHQPLNEGWKK